MARYLSIYPSRYPSYIDIDGSHVARSCGWQSFNFFVDVEIKSIVRANQKVTLDAMDPNFYVKVHQAHRLIPISPSRAHTLVRVVSRYSSWHAVDRGGYGACTDHTTCMPSTGCYLLGSDHG